MSRRCEGGGESQSRLESCRDWIFNRPSSRTQSLLPHQQLRKLERAAGVEHLPNRAFHAFRRSLATMLVEQLGVSQAARWIGDTPDVLLRTYLKPTRETERQAVAPVMEMVYEWRRRRETRTPGPCNPTQTAAKKDWGGRIRTSNLTTYRRNETGRTVRKGATCRIETSHFGRFCVAIWQRSGNRTSTR